MDIVAKQNNLNAYTQHQPMQSLAATDNSSTSSLTQRKPGDIVLISEQSKIQNNIDGLYEQVDKIYMSHISASDKKSLENAYAELDKLFQSGQSTAADDKRAEQLFNQVDKIFNLAEAKLNPQEKQKIDALNSQIDSLFDDYEGDIFDELPDDLLRTIEPLEDELDKILSSRLSAEQKDKLEGLHNEIAKLFDKSDLTDKDEKAIEKAFDKIDGIMNKSFDNLTAEQKQRVEALEGQIDGLFGAIEQQSDVLEGYYSV